MTQPRLSLIRAEDFRRTPWKNGLGWTDQIAISPEGADLRRGDYDWRVSTARITQSADFSPFAEHDRILGMLEGAGVRLSHRFEGSDEPEVVELPTGEIYEFPGDVPTRCELLAGPVQDFSIFVRKGRASATAEWLSFPEGALPPWEPQGQVCLFWVRRGTLELGGVSAREGEVLRAEFARNEVPEALEVRSSGVRVLLIQINGE